MGGNGADEGGQMMILSAVILLIGFVALAGMMGRVNQLGSQTSTENEQALLKEVGPMADTLENAISGLLGSRTVSACWHAGSLTVYAAGSASSFFPEDIDRHVTGANLATSTTVATYESASRITLTTLPTGAASASDVGCTSFGASYRVGTLTFNQFTGSATASAIGCTTCTSTVTVSSPATGFFETGASSSDIGQRITSPSLPPGAYISAVASATSATISCPVACIALAAGTTFTIGDFALSATTTPTIGSAVTTVLETLDTLSASHGVLMDYTITCVGGTATVEVWLSDGVLQVAINPRATFPC
jgi:Tfp pilus assembly protein PilV